MTKPLFVIGCPRSGTTLLRSMITLLDGVYLPPDELQIIEPLDNLIAKGASKNKIKKFLESSNFSDHMKSRDLWPSESDIMEIIAQKETKDIVKKLILKTAKNTEMKQIKYWGDKTPENIFIVNTILELWPDSKFLIVIRDPRDTVLSMNRSWGRSFRRGAVLWKKSIEMSNLLLESTPAQNILKVRYEDITKTPYKQICKISKWLNLTHDEGILKNFKNEERWSSIDASKGIVSSTNSWRSYPHLNHIKLIETIVYVEMINESYEPVFGNDQVLVGDLSLKFLAVLDAFKAIYKYSRERGLTAAIFYKVKQWYLRRR